jgi:hypothetical protein
MNTAKKTTKTNTAALSIPAAIPILPAEVGPDDTIAYNRACSPVPAAVIPAVPAGYRPTNADHRRRSLRLLALELQAEAILALEEIASNAATIEQDLGEFAPDPAPTKALLTRVQDIGKSLAAQEALAQFHREIEDIALSDAVMLLESAHKEYQHRVARVPQLAQRYAALERFFRFRSAAISEGIARAKGGKTDGGKTDGGKTDGGKTDGGKTDG